MQSCFIHVFLIWTEVPSISDVSGVYTSLFSNTDELKMTSVRNQKFSGAFEKRARDLSRAPRLKGVWILKDNTLFAYIWNLNCEFLLPYFATSSSCVHKRSLCCFFNSINQGIFTRPWMMQPLPSCWNQLWSKPYKQVNFLTQLFCNKISKAIV